MNKFRQVLTARNAAIGSAVLLPFVANAQETSAFQQAITTATAAINEYGPSLVGLAAVSLVFMIAIKYVKKIKGAA